MAMIPQIHFTTQFYGFRSPFILFNFQCFYFFDPFSFHLLTYLCVIFTKKKKPAGKCLNSRKVGLQKKGSAHAGSGLMAMHFVAVGERENTYQEIEEREKKATCLWSHSAWSFFVPRSTTSPSQVPGYTAIEFSQV